MQISEGQTATLGIGLFPKRLQWSETWSQDLSQASPAETLGVWGETVSLGTANQCSVCRGTACLARYIALWRNSIANPIAGGLPSSLGYRTKCLLGTVFAQCIGGAVTWAV